MSKTINRAYLRRLIERGQVELVSSYQASTAFCARRRRDTADCSFLMNCSNGCRKDFAARTVIQANRTGSKKTLNGRSLSSLSPEEFPAKDCQAAVSTIEAYGNKKPGEYLYSAVKWLAGPGGDAVKAKAVEA